MDDRHDLEEVLRDHRPPVDPEVKREVLRAFRAHRRPRRSTRALALVATLALLLSASFYAGRVSAPREPSPPETTAAKSEASWRAAESDLI